MNEEIFIKILLIGIGSLLFFISGKISKNASEFYRKLYTEENMKIMFKVCGILLVLTGLFLTFFK